MKCLGQSRLLGITVINSFDSKINKHITKTIIIMHFVVKTGFQVKVYRSFEYLTSFKPLDTSNNKEVYILQDKQTQHGHR